MLFNPHRQVLPEILDDLPADDPRACRSRRDLARVHVAMRSVAVLKRALARVALTEPPRRVLELGGGDGGLLLRLARSLRPCWHDVEVTLVDRLDLVSAATHAAYRELGWRVVVVRAEVLDWLSRPRERYDLCFVNLFLHHFPPDSLTTLLEGIAAGADALVACEPRRGTLGQLGSRLVFLLGANDVTREDAVTSVAAGFRGTELTAAWPLAADGWRCEEFPAWPFTHCFVASRQQAQTHRGLPP